MKTNEQLINEAVAKVAGWKEHPSQENTLCLYNGRQLIRESHKSAQTIQRYTTSYDAILPVIQGQSLSVGQWIVFMKYLSIDENNLWWAAGHKLISVAPLQLCIALLKALNLWTKEIECYERH